MKKKGLMWVILQVFSVLIKEMVVTGELSSKKKKNSFSKQEKIMLVYIY